jgi:hypothetical protein
MTVERTESIRKIKLIFSTMKLLIVSLAFLLVSFQVSAQKKSKSDPKDAKIDNLTMVNDSLTIQLDSVSKELVKYLGLYDAIKEKVLHYNFDPTRSAYLIDSLKTSRDSISAMFATNPKTMVPSDSILNLLKENSIMKIKIDSMNTVLVVSMAVPSEELEKAKAITNLKQLKELLDAKIITDAEFLEMKKKYTDKL